MQKFVEAAEKFVCATEKFVCPTEKFVGVTENFISATEKLKAKDVQNVGQKSNARRFFENGANFSK